MTGVYHLKPDQMTGTTLWPLAQLAEADPTAYEKVTRLADRSNRLPLFVDVIHVLHRGAIPVDAAPVIRA